MLAVHDEGGGALLPLTRQPRRRYSSYPLGQIDYTLTYEPILPWDFVAQNAYFNSVQSVFSERELQIGIGIGSYDDEDAQVVAGFPPRLRF